MKKLFLILVLLCPKIGLAITVDAGPNKTFALPAKDISLFGHVSNAAGPTTIAWSNVSGPGTVTFSAPWALATTASFTTAGSYVLRLTANDGTAVTADVTITLNSAASQRSYYVDPYYTGGGSDGSAAHPWTSLRENDTDYTTNWNTIQTDLGSADVIIYFPARQAQSDVSATMDVSGHMIFIGRACRAGTYYTCTPTDTSTHYLTLDGMSVYNNDNTHSVANWVPYNGANKFKITCNTACSGGALGTGDDLQRDYIRIRGFEVTGSSARVLMGGNFFVMEYMWIHDTTTLDPQFLFGGTGSTDAYPACHVLGVSHDITLRNNKLEKGMGEGIYIAASYPHLYGGCPSRGNSHNDILVEGNTVNDPGINGTEGDIDFKTGLYNLTVRNNIFYNLHNVEEGGINFSGAYYNEVASVNMLVGGSGYTNGTYTDVQLTGGTGVDARAAITVSGGQVVSVTVTATGTGHRYTVGDTLTACVPASCPTQNIGFGTGFSVRVASVVTQNTNIVIEQNNIYAGVGGMTNGGIMAFGMHGLVIRNNLIYNTPSGAGINLADADGWYDCYNVEIYSNTVYGNNGGIWITRTHTLKLRNNVVFGNSGTSQITGNTSDTIDSDYNLLAPNGYDTSFIPTPGSHDVIQASTTGIVVDASTGDFHLTATSPARGAGLSLATTLTPPPDTGFTNDYYGLTRSAPWDIGAIKF